MSSAADTIREALANPRTKWCSRCEADALNDPCVCTEWDNADARAALTELEQQLADLRVGMIAAARTAEADREAYMENAAENARLAAKAEADRDRLQAELDKAIEQAQFAGVPAWTRLWNEKERYREALEQIGAKQQQTLETLRSNGIVFDNLDDHWQKVAFTIYNDLCEMDTWAHQALDDGVLTAALATPDTPPDA